MTTWTILIFKILTWDEPSQPLLITLAGTVRPGRKENIMYEDEKIIFIDTDTLTMEEQEEMIQEENKNEQAKKL